jgi:hypothetical protein
MISMARWCSAIFLVLLLASGCSRTDNTTGVENNWRDSAFKAIVGATNEGDVLEALGPPSQIINLGDQTVFYYIKENFRSDRLLLILYNQTERRTIYDRAVFFFDAGGVLRKVAFSETALPNG